MGSVKAGLSTVNLSRRPIVSPVMPVHKVSMYIKLCLSRDVVLTFTRQAPFASNRHVGDQKTLRIRNQSLVFKEGLDKLQGSQQAMTSLTSQASLFMSSVPSPWHLAPRGCFRKMRGCSTR